MDENENQDLENETQDTDLSALERIEADGFDAPSEQGEEFAGDDFNDDGVDDIGADGDTEIPDADHTFDAPLDIEAALASVASLDDVLAEHAAIEAAEAERQAAEAAALEQVEQVRLAEESQRAAYYLPRPPVVGMLRRGQAASAVPALLLVALGAWLTFTLALQEAAPSPGVVLLIVVGGVGLSLLAYWVTSARWARGALVAGLSLVLSAGLLFFLAQTESPGADGWPLLLLVVAGCILLAAWIAPPVGESHLFGGVIVGVAGLVALAVTTGFVSDSVLDLFRTLAPGILIAGVVVLLLPTLPRRRP